MSNIEKYMDNLLIEFKRNQIEDIEEISMNEKLMYLYCYYHYFNADSSKLSDIVQGNVYQKMCSDPICGIYIDGDSDNNDVDVIISEYVENDDDYDFAVSLKALKDAEKLLMNYKNGENIRSDIYKILAEDDYKFSNLKPLKIKLITNFNPKTSSKKKIILNALNTLKAEEEYVSFSLSFGYDIEYEIMEIENPKEYVDIGYIKIDSSQNYVVYGNEESMLVNISARSVKNLYEQYGYRGLFAQNLRYYVKNSKIDNNIIKSIQERSDIFWYLNNGIIIICDDYLVTDDEILLEKFSIINGGQTTKLIGEAEFDNDFYLQCKIIKNKYKDEEDKVSFIAQVAEASNTQKPIKDKDLIANKPEQRLLKKQLAEAGIYCQIKRGEKVNKKLYPMAWQNTTNEELGQFLLAFVYQRPGIARANKASICGNKERYSLLFNKKYNSDFVMDLLKIKAFYKLWVTNLKKTDDGIDEYKIGLSSYGMFFETALIGAVCKIYYHPNYLNSLESAVLSDQKIEILSQHDIDHHFLKPDVTKEQIFDLFDLCYAYFYRPGYEVLKSFKSRYNSFSNFTKVDSNYKTYVFRQVCSVLEAGIPQRMMDRLKGILYEANSEELKRDKQLLSIYANSLSDYSETPPEIEIEKAESIKEALVEYRTKTYKQYRMKAYEVFTNAVCNKLARYAPTDMDALIALHCLDDYQLKVFGPAIVDVINRVLHE